MVKLVACLRRKADMSAAEFHEYWKDTHGPLVKSVTEFSRYIRRYTQSHTLQDPMRHRAVLFGLPDGLMVYAAFQKDLQVFVRMDRVVRWRL